MQDYLFRFRYIISICLFAWVSYFIYQLINSDKAVELQECVNEVHELQKKLKKNLKINVETLDSEKDYHIISGNKDVKSETLQALAINMAHAHAQYQIIKETNTEFFLILEGLGNNEQLSKFYFALLNNKYLINMQVQVNAQTKGLNQFKLSAWISKQFEYHYSPLKPYSVYEIFCPAEHAINKDHATNINAISIYDLQLQGHVRVGQTHFAILQLPDFSISKVTTGMEIGAEQALITNITSQGITFKINGKKALHMPITGNSK